MSNVVLTPQMVENRLKELSREIDESHSELVEAESHYLSVKAQYEIALAKSRLNMARRSSPTGKNYTVGEREDLAIVENEELHLRMASAEALVRGARANAQRIRTQVDIARSIGTSVRTSLDVL
jgi:multidrug resistance efflux pump